MGAHYFYDMKYETVVFLFDTLAIIILIILALILCLAHRFKGKECYAVLIIFITTMCDYIYNICDYMEWRSVALITAPVAYSVNLTVMPFMFFLTHRGFNPKYKLTLSTIIHFIPAIFFAILVVINVKLTPIEELMNFTIARVASFRSLLTGVNFLIILLQLIVYFYLIFSYMRKVKLYIFNNLSRTELLSKIWIPRFVTFIGVLIIVAMIASLFNPLEGFRLFYIINILALIYLLYLELDMAFVVRDERHAQDLITISEYELNSGVTQDQISSSAYDIEQLQKIADNVNDYLITSEAYVNPNLSLRDVSKATGITYNNISRAINLVLNKNFFLLINEMRIEKSKSMLMEKKKLGFTLETIAEQCGFNSQVTYCNVFKRQMGMTTNQWLKLMKPTK